MSITTIITLSLVVFIVVLVFVGVAVAKSKEKSTKSLKGLTQSNRKIKRLAGIESHNRPTSKHPPRKRPPPPPRPTRRSSSFLDTDREVKRRIEERFKRPMPAALQATYDKMLEKSMDDTYKQENITTVTINKQDVPPVKARCLYGLRGINGQYKSSFE